ncbi:MAG: hypothetical protein QXU98_02070 [Candidatus Parvarchaeota archaeon]
MGLFNKKNDLLKKNSFLDTIVNGVDEEKIARFADMFSKYVNSRGIKLSYDPSDKQFKLAKDPSNYDAFYIDPFDANRLFYMVGQLEMEKNPKLRDYFSDDPTDTLPQKLYDDNKMMWLGMGLSGYRDFDKKNEIIDSIKRVAGYPQNKPLDVIISDPANNSELQQFIIFFDIKDRYQNNPKPNGYNPYTLTVALWDGMKSLGVSIKDGVQFEKGEEALYLPNPAHPVKNLLITPDLPYYKLGLVVNSFLDQKVRGVLPQKINSNGMRIFTPASYNLKEEFTSYLKNNL